MQQEQSIYTIQESIPGRISATSNVEIDAVKPQDQEKNKNQQNKQYRITQQPANSKNVDDHNGSFFNNKSTTNKKKKKQRRPRCCRKSLQSDKKRRDDCGTWFCCIDCDSCCCSCDDGCGSCGSCGDCGD
ncbi:unnamed protein product [Adineta steineri]|uniref:Uncharacterized protein n=1 Tax=Adineta steineri TaxID=433720 RepID=A0A820B640_9BILA|nr:unnamed protein product [Adineta steineri]CAF4187410.1 unnamed protein product [Adineta steineri]